MKDLIVIRILMLFSAFWMPLAVNILIDEKIKWQKRLICSILSMISYILIFSQNSSEIMALIYFPVMMIFVYFCLNRSAIHLLLVPASYIIVLNCNYIAASINRNYLSGWSFGSRGDMIVKRGILVTILVAAVSFVIRLIIIFFKKRIMVNFSKEIIICMALIVVLCTMLCLGASWSQKKLGREGLLYELAVFLYTIVTLAVVTYAIRVVHMQESAKRKVQEHKDILEYTSHIENMYEELRGFRHDYVNILASLSGYIEKNDMKGLEKYFNETIMPTNEKMNSNKYRLQKLSKIENPAIKGLVSNKLIYAMSTGIDVFIDIMDEIKDVDVRDIDLCRILGIYLDNAVEAAGETEEKELKFNIIQDNGSTVIVIMNSFINKGISISNMEKQGFSTKGEGRGLGLSNVVQVLGQYENVNKVTEIRDNYFIQTLIISENEKKKAS
ncbi:sensor histidine kinase [Eubacterium ruminantium]|uniref:sensor histidine kinase n=1 Tax=Eubacterium ruminantium TaxID=42322 RepID=UPI001569CBD7|nr:GHKL domain-containing protein [Eubacterium ruminantium]